VTLGRQYTPYYEVLRDVADPFALGYAGTAKNLFPVGSAGTVAASGGGTRTDNAVVYRTPNQFGFVGTISYSVGEVAGDASAQRQLGASLVYGNGPLNVALVYNNRNNDTAVLKQESIGHNGMIAANYDFKIVKAYAAFSQDKGLNSAPLNNTGAPYGFTGVASKDSTDALIGLTAPVGDTAGTVMASYIRKDDKEVANRDARQWALGYSYALSKRTSTYVSYAKITNKNGASYTVGGNSEVGTGDKAFNVGMRHSF
jgi:predicted porin